ncbi:hypothetical protein GME_07814, partial [Halomonas sp. TD01]
MAQFLVYLVNDACIEHIGKKGSNFSAYSPWPQKLSATPEHFAKVL